MIVIKRIVYTLPLSSVLNNFQGSQNPELMGYGGLGLLTDHGYVTHTMFSFQQRQYNFKPGRVAEGLKYFCHPHKFFPSGKLL